VHKSVQKSEVNMMYFASCLLIEASYHASEW